MTETRRRAPSRSDPIRSVSVAEAKAHLSEILESVEKGESVEITNRGRPVADLIPKLRARKPIDLEWVRSVTAGMTPSKIDSADLIREIRDEGP